MTASAILNSVARSTGEDPRRLARLGFSMDKPNRRNPLGDVLGVECPFCGRHFPLATQPRDLPEFADCPHCDTAFSYEDSEVVRIPLDDLTKPGGEPIVCHAA